MLEIKKILDEMHSETGLCSEYFCIKAPKSGINISIKQNGEYYTILFEGEKPEVKLNKFLKVGISLNSISLGEESGYLSIGVLPKIPFKYSWILYHKTELEQ